VSRLAGVAGALVVLLLSLAFAAQNGSQTVTLRLWLITLYQVPLTVVTFAALLVGMLMMFVTGIQSDLKVRRILRERLAEEDREEKARLQADRNQRDLFEDRE
jgi:uncharacterized integral membrane protein